jgi:Domain of unknown function (DUF1905)/Bacteriocin-protection, YdeI or OmpD-Associated
MAAKSDFHSIIERLPYKGGMHFIRVPQRIALLFSERKSVRIFCMINDTIEYPCALRPDGKGGFFINVGTPILKKGNLTLNQKIRTTIRKDNTKYGHKIPAELSELLAQDLEGKLYWDGLSNGAQRSLIYYIAQAKSIEKRIERSLLFINRLKDTKGAWKPGKT